jgi:pimeloyl-ACP methyl ester carboxylesterase
VPDEGAGWPGECLAVGPWQVFVRRAPRRQEGAVPAVFVHGLGGGSTTWTDLMGLLADEVDGYAVDLPGFGLSPAPPEPAYTVPAQARVLHALLERLGRPAHLVGNSLGAAASLQAAAHRPDLVRTLTLVSPTLPDWRPRPAIVAGTGLLVPGLGPWLMHRQAEVTVEQQARQVLTGLTGPAARLAPRHYAQVEADIRAASANSGIAEAYVGALRGALANNLRRGPRGLWGTAAGVSLPTLVVLGTADPFVHPRIAARTARTIRGSRVLVLSGIGHLAHLEAAQTVADGFRALLRSTEPQ